MLTLPLTSGTLTTVETTINGERYGFTTKWNKRNSFYSLDVKFNGEELIFGIKLVFGVDIMAQHTQIPLNRVYVINKLNSNHELLIDGLDNENGLVVIIEDSDLGV